jgi:hypothetical protein
MKPGSDMPCGSASSLTVSEPPASRSITSRRVESDKAQNTLSSTAESPLTRRFRYIPGKGCSMLTRLRSVS